MRGDDMKRRETSILDRFCAPLCESVCGTDEKRSAEQLGGAEFLEVLRSKGLLCVALDEQREWYRYHHLFQELLKRQLDLQHSPKEIAELHHRAAAWLEDQGLIEEALQHALKAGDDTQAGQMIIRHRNEITQKEQWHRLDRWLNMLPSHIVEDNPELLILRAWFSDNRGRQTEVGLILDQIEPRLDPLGPDGPDRRRLHAEVMALRSYLHYVAAEGQQALDCSRQALDELPLEYASERGYATIFVAVSLQMTGDVHRAYETVHNALSSEVHHGGTYHGRLLMTLGFIQWMEGGLTELMKTSTAMLKLGEKHGLAETVAYARFLKGIALYHHDRLTAAKTVIEPVVVNPAIANVANYLLCIPVLALTLQGRESADEALELVEGSINQLLEAGNTD